MNTFFNSILLQVSSRVSHNCFSEQMYSAQIQNKDSQ